MAGIGAVADSPPFMNLPPSFRPRAEVAQHATRAAPGVSTSLDANGLP